MNKSELIEGVLRAGRKSDYKGMKIFSQFFAQWLSEQDFSYHKSTELHGSLGRFVPQLAADAAREFSTSVEPHVAAARMQYEQEVGHEFPELIELGTADYNNQQLTSRAVGTLLKGIDPELLHMEHLWQEYADSQRNALQTVFDKFLCLVYRRGLRELMLSTENGEWRGVFNGTEFLTSRGGDYINFAFISQRMLNEPNIKCTFVGLQKDPLALGAGFQIVRANLHECLKMINDVVIRLSDDKEKQKFWLQPQQDAHHRIVS